MFIQRFRLTLREQKIVIPSLPEGLNGMRLVQLTDIHLSPFLSERELAQAVAIANETRAHVALVTGDLISGPGDPLDACIARLARFEDRVGNLRLFRKSRTLCGSGGLCPDDKEREFGLHFLRDQAVKLSFGNAALNLVGVDYQRFNRPYLKDVETLWTLPHLTCYSRIILMSFRLPPAKDSR